MKTVTSPDNKLYTAFLKLYQKKYRDRTGEYPAEGLNAVNEALSNCAKIVRVFIREGFEWENGHGHEKTVKRLNDAGAEIITLPVKLFDRAADTCTPQGITAVVKKNVYSVYDAERFFTGCSGGSAVVLDRVQDPGNIGTILRTASAAGFNNIIAVKGTGDIFSPKTVRAAAGAVFRVRIMLADSSEDAAAVLRAADIKMVCTAPASGEICFETDLSGSIALIIGNEAGGACDYFMKNSDMNVRLPMRNGTESLNAAAAAAVVMYESVRQRFFM